MYTIVAMNWDSGSDENRPYMVTMRDTPETEESVFFYHGLGPSRMTLRRDSFEIVANYGPIDIRNDIKAEEAWRKAEIQYYKDFPLVTGVCDRDGWLAPDGTYYPCVYQGHNSRAWEIHFCRHFDDNKMPRNSARALEEEGWLLVSTSGVNWAYVKEITTQQVTTIHKLVKVSTYPGRTEGLKKTLERHRDYISQEEGGRF